MANLLIETRCNARCPYCFASGLLQNTGPASSVSIETFLHFLDFLDEASIGQVRLLGGEPTLHPEFAALVRLADQRGKEVVVFTNGLMPESALQALAVLPEERCRVLVNASATGAGGFSKKEQERRLQGLKVLGRRARLGVTLVSPRFAFDPLYEWITASGCFPSIRIGLAHPSPAGGLWLQPKQYKIVGARLALASSLAAEQGIRFEFDCGFVRCMFTDDELHTLRRNHVEMSWTCSPVVDIDPAGLAIACFPLSEEVRIPGALSQPAVHLRARFEEELRALRVIGVYPACSTCPERIASHCSGGCLGVALRRMHSVETLPDILIRR